MDLDFPTHGAQLFPAAARASLPGLRAALARFPSGRPGLRMSGMAPLPACFDPIDAIARQAIGPESRPVRAILFDKTARANWSLDWHQDRTICVRARIEVAGFGP